MAIDTAEKRRAASGVIFLPWGPGVTPDVAKDAEWRRQAGWSYTIEAVVTTAGGLIGVKLDLPELSFVPPATTVLGDGGA